MRNAIRFVIAFFLCFLYATVVDAQASASNGVPPATQSSVTFNVGASALGAGGMNATAAADVTLELNPGFATKSYLSQVSLLSDNAQAPGINWQYYGGGFAGPFPKVFSSSSQLAPLTFFWRGTAGVERIVPSKGPSTAYVGAMIGAGAKWQMQSGVVVKLFEVGFIVSPHAAWGNKVPYFGGSISYLFGH